MSILGRGGVSPPAARGAGSPRPYVSIAFRPPTGREVAYALLILLLTAGVLVPFGALLARSVSLKRGLSLAAYEQVFGNPAQIGVIGRSLLVACGSTLFACLNGVGLALLVARTDLPARAWLRPAFALSYFIPPFIGAIAWLQVIGPAGYLNKLWMALSGGEPLFRAYGAGGMIFLLALHNYPLVYLSVLGALDRLDPSLEWAGEVCGASPWQVLRRITLGLAAPAVLAGTFLAFAAALADFGVAAVVGLPANYTVLSTKIFQLVRSFDLADNFAQAAAMSTILLAFGLVALWLEYLWLGGRRFATLSSSARREAYYRLGPFRKLALAFALFFLLTTLALPLCAVALTSLTRVYGLPPFPANWTLDNFRQVLFEAPETVRALRNSLLLAAGSATAIMALGFLTAHAGRSTDRARVVLEFLVAVPYAVPGVVVGLAMILAALQLKPSNGFSLYNTIWIILVAYLARFLIFGVRTASAALAQIHEGLIEAARVSGASWARTQLQVALPLVRKSLLAGWLLVFVPALTELTVSVLLWSVGNETVGVAVYNLQDHGNLVGSASLALVVMVLVLIGNWLAQRLAGEASAI